MTKQIDDPIHKAGIGSVAERIKELMGEDSLRKFSLKVGMSDGAIRKILQGSTPSLDSALKIATACNVSIDWLATGKCAYSEKVIERSDLSVEHIAPKHDSTTQNNTIYLTPEQNQEISEEFVLVPGYHIQVSAGHGCNVWDEKPKRWLAFRRKYLSYKKLSPEHTAVVFARGDSMADTITDNDSLLIDTSSTTPIDGHIYIVRLGDELYAKRVQKSFDGSLTLISDNKDYSPIQVPKDKLPELCIVGKVVQRSTDF